MRTLRILPCHLILPLCLAGCASTSHVSSKMKTVASVGDKTLPVVTGEPGASVVAEVAPPERPVRSEGRISGRVVDQDGNPLPDVRVRLAVGSAPGGRLISAKTDRTGAFTLNRVRPGSSYTVIAEWEDGQEYLSGRQTVEAPDTDVQITLAGPEAEAKTARAGAEPSRVSPVSEREAIPEESDVEPERADVEAPRLTSRKPRVNVEDLPPAPEAEAYDSPATIKAPASSRPEPQPPARGVRWRPIGSDGVTRHTPPNATERELASSAPQDPEAREAGVIAAAPLADDDGPNPLPPALEPGEASAPPEEADPLPPARETRRSRPARDDVDPLPPAREPGQMSVATPARRRPTGHDEAPDHGPEPEPSEGNPLPAALEPAQEGTPFGTPLASPEAESGQTSNSPTSADPGLLPGPVEAEAPAELAAASGPANESPAASATDLVSALEPPPELSSELPGPVEAAPPELAAAAPPELAAAAPPELAAAAPSPGQVASARPQPEPNPFEANPFEPVPAATAVAGTDAASDQSVFESAPDAGTVAPEPVAAAESSSPETRKRPTWKDLASTAPTGGIPREGPKSKVAKPPVPTAIARRAYAAPTEARAAPVSIRNDTGEDYCDYDPKHRKINDFRLPDLEGRPVRFKDLDADLVLIDFWGTWCQPCIRSIPHLVELQKRIDTSKLKVVGVACEQGPPAERVKKVAEEARRLGINYPVLMSGMDGSCPLQEAMQVQAFPTLILVDRQGRIVWRDQGATPVTLARLDRFLASASKSNDVRRY